MINGDNKYEISSKKPLNPLPIAINPRNDITRLYNYLHKNSADDIRSDYPNLSHYVLRRYKGIYFVRTYWLRLLSYVGKHHDNLYVDGRIILSLSYQELGMILSPGRIWRAQSLTSTIDMFCRLGILNKLSDTEIPAQVMDCLIQEQYLCGRMYRRNAYAIGIDINLMEKNAEEMKAKHYTLTGAGMEFTIRTEGQQAAIQRYPQHRDKIRMGLNPYTEYDVEVIKSFINERISEQGYCLVSDISGQQWARSVNQVLEELGLALVRADSFYKEFLNIDIKGHPNILIPKEYEVTAETLAEWIQQDIKCKGYALCSEYARFKALLTEAMVVSGTVAVVETKDFKVTDSKGYHKVIIRCTE